MVKSPLLRLLCGLCSSAVVSATPALVWSNTAGSSRQEESSPSSVFTSDEIAAAALLDDAAPLQVVFLLGRGSDGSESLTRMAPFLSSIVERSPADVIHSHVAGVESLSAMKRTLAAAAAAAASQQAPVGNNKKDKNKVAVVGLHELGMKFNASPMEQAPAPMTTTTMTTTTTTTKKKSREISAANILLVDVDAQTSPEVLAGAVHQAIAHADRVVLTAVRSIGEVKDERAKITRRRMEMQYQAGAHIVDGRHRRRRRLENNQNQQAVVVEDQVSGAYFVQMTPNILAGLLFFFLFATIAWIGISCMGMIAAQDTYVKKMPAVGREA
jgi:hypothetical protein